MMPKIKKVINFLININMVVMTVLTARSVISLIRIGEYFMAVLMVLVLILTWRLLMFLEMIDRSLQQHSGAELIRDEKKLTAILQEIERDIDTRYGKAEQIAPQQLKDMIGEIDQCELDMFSDISSVYPDQQNRVQERYNGWRGAKTKVASGREGFALFHEWARAQFVDNEDGAQFLLGSRIERCHNTELGYAIYLFAEVVSRLPRRVEAKRCYHLFLREDENSELPVAKPLDLTGDFDPLAFVN